MKYINAKLKYILMKANIKLKSTKLLIKGNRTMGRKYETIITIRNSRSFQFLKHKHLHQKNEVGGGTTLL